jgi:TPR repeat protein
MTAYEIESRAADLIARKEYEQAWSLLEPLSSKGSSHTLLYLGWISEVAPLISHKGMGAKYYYKQAALAGASEGYLRLGRILFDEEDFNEAREAFRKGTEEDNLGSMFELGRMLRNGEGGEALEEEGVNLLKIAAKKGHIFSQRELVRIKYHKKRDILSKLFEAMEVFWIIIKALYYKIKEKDYDKFQ